MSDFRVIYETHVAFVFRTLRRFGVPESALDDAVQDVFTVVHTKSASFEGRSTIKTWIFGIARRVAVKHREKDRERLVGSEIELEADARGFQSSDAEQLDRAQLLYLMLGKLSAEQREIFLLIELEQFTMREAADVLSENENTLASRLRKARSELRHILSRMQTQNEWRDKWPS